MINFFVVNCGKVFEGIGIHWERLNFAWKNEFNPEKSGWYWSWKFWWKFDWDDDYQLVFMKEDLIDEFYFNWKCDSVAEE